MEDIILRNFVNALFVCGFLIYLYVCVVVIYNGDILQRSYNAGLLEYCFKNANFNPFRHFINVYIGQIKPNQLINFLQRTLILFIPMGIFIPILFESMNNVKRFFYLMLAAAIIVSTFDIIFVSGTIDIEKVFLYIVGSMIGYLITRSEKVRYTFYFRAYRRSRKRFKYNKRL